MIRPEQPEDIESIRNINKEAFRRENESKLVDKLRNRGVLTISLVAVRDKEVVGHIAFSPVVVEPETSGFMAITLADSGLTSTSAKGNWFATGSSRP